MTIIGLWWRLTKLVLTGRGRYAVYLRLEDPTDPFGGLAREVSDAEDWAPRDIDWVGGEDRFIVIEAQPETALVRASDG